MEYFFNFILQARPEVDLMAAISLISYGRSVNQNAGIPYFNDRASNNGHCKIITLKIRTKMVTIKSSLLAVLRSKLNKSPCP